MALQPNPIDLTTVQAVKDWLAATQQGVTSDNDNIQSCITSASAYWLWRTGRGNSDGSIPSASSFVQPITLSEVYDGEGGDRLFLRITPIQSVASVKVFNVAIPASPDGVSAGFVIDGGRKAIAIVGQHNNFFFGRNGPFGVFQNSFGGMSPTFGGFRFVQGVQNIFVTYTAGFPSRAIVNELQTIPLKAPFTISVFNVPWLSDSGVNFFVGGSALAPVLIAPSTGQYFVQGAGVYLFSSADAGKQVLLSYQASGVPPDVQDKCRVQVATNYRRKSWIDQKSQAMAQGAGTVSFRDWELPPDVVSTMNNYTRRAPVYGG